MKIEFIHPCARSPSLLLATFNDKSKLKVHERQVHQANPVPCEVCGELQFNKYSLHSHLQIHKEVICNSNYEINTAVYDYTLKLLK